MCQMPASVSGKRKQCWFLGLWHWVGETKQCDKSRTCATYSVSPRLRGTGGWLQSWAQPVTVASSGRPCVAAEGPAIEKDILCLLEFAVTDLRVKWSPSQEGLPFFLSWWWLNIILSVGWSKSSSPTVNGFNFLFHQHSEEQYPTTRNSRTGLWKSW